MRQPPHVLDDRVADDCQRVVRYVAADSQPVPIKPTIIDPPGGWELPRFREVWEFRELLYFLTWRDVKVRYRQTALGVLWALLQPLLAMLVFSLFFGRLANVSSDGVPYAVFALAGLVPWTFFAFGLNESANSLVGSRQLITKVYFPRLAIPLATVLAGAVDFAIGFVLLLVVMASYGIVPNARLLLIAPLLLLGFTTAFGAGLWLAALNVQYRDVRYVLPFLTQLWMFVTPIVYSSSIVPARWRALYGLNPMVGVVDVFRWALLGTPGPSGAIAASVIAALVLAGGGALYFRRMERAFADVI